MSQEFNPPADWGLTRKQTQILNALLSSTNTASRETIYDALYKDDLGGGPEIDIIDVFVCKMRPKLAKALCRSTPIETVWGRGYRLSDESKEEIRAHHTPAPQQPELPELPGALRTLNLTPLETVLAARLLKPGAEGYVTFEELEQHARDAGYKPNTRAAIRKPIHNIRDRFESAGFIVFNRRGWGWRVVPITPQEQAA